MNTMLAGLAISDLHLGSIDCDAKTILSILKNNPHETLFIVGDLVDGKVKIIDDDQWEVADYIRSKKDKVIIDGNHDPKEEKLVKTMLNIKAKVKKRHLWSVNERMFYFEHGHRFQAKWLHRLFKYPFFDKIFYRLIRVFKSLHIGGFGAPLIIDWIHQWVDNKVAKKAIRKTERHNAQVFIGGDTHYPNKRIVLGENGKAIEYFNCGGPGKRAYVAIHKDGTAELKFANGST